MNAASARLVFGRCSLPVHPAHPALLGAMLSRRSIGCCFLQRKQLLCVERLRLLCYGCPLSALLLRLAIAVHHSGRAIFQSGPQYCLLVTRIMKRYFSVTAHGM
jgi:hypothetical protein